MCTNVQYENIRLYWVYLLMYDKYIHNIFKYYNTSLSVLIKSLPETTIIRT